MSVLKASVVALIVAVGIFASPTLCRAAGPATTQAAGTPPDLETSWENLAKNEPFATRAVLDFASNPTQAVAFFESHLKPLKLDEKELDAALTDLASDDEKVWKPAFEKLQYLDPRLCRGLEKLMEDTTDSTARYRLVALLCGQPSETYKGKNVMLRNTGGDSFNFFSQNSSWWAESKVSRLDSFEGGWIQKKQWVRADRAIVILQHIGTPEALSILKEMASGNPEALPTKVAQAAVESLGGADK